MTDGGDERIDTAGDSDQLDVFLARAEQRAAELEAARLVATARLEAAAMVADAEVDALRLLVEAMDILVADRGRVDMIHERLDEIRQDVARITVALAEAFGEKPGEPHIMIDLGEDAPARVAVGSKEEQE